MILKTIDFHLNRDEKTRAFYEFVVERKTSLISESAIFVVMSIAAFVVSGFQSWMIIPFIFAVWNAVLIGIAIPEAQYHHKLQSLNYLIEHNIEVIFLELKILSKIMKEKSMTDEEIEKWCRFYMKRIFDNKSLSNINTIIDDIKQHFYRITLCEFPAIPEKDLRKFIKTEAPTWWNKYYPHFKKDMANKQFVRTRAKDNAGTKLYSGNVKLEQSLKVLGLPGTVRDFKTVKARYYELIKQYHPDAPQNKNKNKKEINEKIIEINTAYQEAERILKNGRVNL